MAISDKERRERAREATRKWREKNPGKVSAYRSAYRASERGSEIERSYRTGAGKAVRAAWLNARPDYRAALKARAYGLELRDWRDLLATQNNLCAVCHAAITERTAKTDHCHAHGHVRGLLCNSCNLAAGHLKDDPERVLALHRYLKSNIPAAALAA